MGSAQVFAAFFFSFGRILGVRHGACVSQLTGTLVPYAMFLVGPGGSGPVHVRLSTQHCAPGPADLGGAGIRGAGAGPLARRPGRLPAPTTRRPSLQSSSRRRSQWQLLHAHARRPVNGRASPEPPRAPRRTSSALGSAEAQDNVRTRRCQRCSLRGQTSGGVVVTAARP